MMIKIITKTASIFFALACILIASNSFAEQKIDKSSEKICTSSDKNKKLDEKSYVMIGGIKQWVTIKGNSCANPVVLIVHGGPGNPSSIFSDALYKDWENDFTIVNWDQRGSGKTYEANQKSGDITFEIADETELNENLIVKDGIEVTNYIREKLNKKKIIINGGSWGSFVAVKMIASNPELFNFYVGSSQVVNYNDGLLNTYKTTLEKVRANGDQQTTEMLESLGTPPWTNPRNFGKLRKITRKLETQAGDQPIDYKIGPEYTTQEAIDAYSSGEAYSFIKFIGAKNNGMAQRIELDKTNLEFKIPIYLIQGEVDLLTLPELTENYFNKIKAPKKKFITVKNCGHDPNYRMLNAQLQANKDGLKSLTK